MILGFYFNLYNLGEKFKMFTVSLYGGIFNSNCKIEYSTFLFLNCQTSLYVTYFSYTVVPLKAEKGLFLWNNSWLSISLGCQHLHPCDLWICFELLGVWIFILVFLDPSNRYCFGLTKPWTLTSIVCSVLVHSGGVHGGHYYAFIRPTLSSQWYAIHAQTCFSCLQLKTILLLR